LSAPEPYPPVDGANDWILQARSPNGLVFEYVAPAETWTFSPYDARGFESYEEAMALPDGLRVGDTPVTPRMRKDAIAAFRAGRP
jgi:hypothetical protein